MSNFSDMTLDEQVALCQKVSQCLKDNDLADVNVGLYREEVCQLTQDDVKGRTLLRCEKQLPSTKSAQVDRFKEAVKTVVDGVEGVSISVASAVGAGDSYKTITGVTTIDDADTKVNIDHVPGTVMLIDFWATWCPPCQRPMQHNQDMLTEHEAKWGDKVKIIGLSIDKDAATVKKHVEAKGWTKPIHYHRSGSDCSDVYSVRGVPHVLILDTNGMIAFKGHPANRKDLVQDFDDLLAGKTLTGEGCAQAGGDKPKEDGEDTDKGAKVSVDDIKSQMAQMTKFQEVGKQLQAECKEDATGMMRNFCVLTVEADLNTQTGSWSSKFTNHRVLVGSQAKIDAVKAKIEAKMDGGDWNFEKNEQCHPM